MAMRDSDQATLMRIDAGSVRVGPTIEQRFPTSASAPSPTDEMRAESNTVREATVDLAELIESLVPAGRWKSIALGHLEDVLMYANKAIYNERRPDAKPDIR